MFSSGESAHFVSDIKMITNNLHPDCDHQNLLRENHKLVYYIYHLLNIMLAT